MRSAGPRLEKARVRLLDRALDLVFYVRKRAHEHSVPGRDLIDPTQLRTGRITRISGRQLEQAVEGVVHRNATYGPKARFRTEFPQLRLVQSERPQALAVAGKR